MKRIFGLAIMISVTSAAFAQDAKKKMGEEKANDTCKSKTYISIGSGGIHMGKRNKTNGMYVTGGTGGDTVDNRFAVQFGMLDLGFNYLQDNTDYSSSGTQAFLGVNQDMK